MVIELSEFETLFKSNFNKLCNLSNRIVRDKEAAKDIVQEVFARVWSNRSELAMNNATNYLSRSVTNSSLNFLESRKKFVQISDTLVSREATFSDQTIIREIEQRIINSIENLPTQCRVIFCLSRFEGLTYKQIADQQNLSVKTVETQMGRALKQLRNDLKPFLTKEFISTVIAIGISFLLPYLTVFLLMRIAF